MKTLFKTFGLALVGLFMAAQAHAAVFTVNGVVILQGSDTVASLSGADTIGVVLLGTDNQSQSSNNAAVFSGTNTNGAFNANLILVGQGTTNSASLTRARTFGVINLAGNNSAFASNNYAAGELSNTTNIFGINAAGVFQGTTNSISAAQATTGCVACVGTTNTAVSSNNFASVSAINN